MAANAVPFRSTIFYTTAGVPASAGSILTVGANGTQNFTSNLALNTLTASTISMQSTTIALGQSTNQRYTNFTNGSFSSTLMTSTLTSYNSLSTVTKVSMSQDGRLQYALQSVPSTLSYYQLARSADTGVTWNTLNTSTMGLPQGSLAYQSTVSGTPTYSNFSQSATGQYALAATSGGQLYVSNNANSATPVYTPANVGGAPYAYLPMETTPPTDMMGNTTITVTGSAPLVAGKIGTSAINLANTAGGTATNYIRGSWTGASSFTVSFWFNAQSLANYTNLFTSYNTTVTIYINPSPFYIAIYVGGTNILSTTAILTNRWYNVTAVYQNGGTCSLYLNNSLVASGTASWNSSLVSSYALGTSVVDQSSSLNGYIDDFRLYNFAAPNVMNPFIYLPLDGNVVDAMGNTTITPGSAPSSTAIPGYVFGAAVGTRTLSFENPASGTAVQFIRGSWTYLNNFTVSLWANIKNIASPGYQIIYSSHNTIVLFYLNPSNQLVTQLPSGSGSNFTLITTSFPITINTWYQLTMIFQINGLCSFYVNNSLIGTFTNSGGFGTVTSSTLFSLGTYDTATTFAFNGYIDDFRIYNYAITPSPITPMNWSHTAVSGTGQYMMAAAANGGVFCSTNYGATWSQLTASQIPSLVGTGNAAKTLMGPIIQPNSTVATAATWSANGVTWTASASTTISTFFPYKAFNNTTGDSWNNTSQTYTTGGNSSGTTTTIQGIGSVQGDWVQLQSTVSLLIYSYQLAVGGAPIQFPSTFYIIGSNDNTTWYPIQKCVAASTVSAPAAVNTLIAGTIIASMSGSQTFGGSTLTTTTYSTTTNVYTYFRILGTNTYSATNGYLEIGEWLINFSTPMPLLTAPATAPNTSAVTVSPQMTNMTAPTDTTTWSTPNGVTWKATATSTYIGNNPTNYAGLAFNGLITGGQSWASGATYVSGVATSSPLMSGVITSSGTINIRGESLQIQSSVPLVMNSYSYSCDGYIFAPKSYYILGSNDASTWYNLHSASTSTNPFGTTANIALTTYIIVNYTGTQTLSSAGAASTIATTTTTQYSTSAYTYFRIIADTVHSGTLFQLGEWFINFTAYTPNPVNALAITNGGQTQLVAATGTTMPNAVGVTPAAITTWTANGVTWTASGIYLNSNYFPYYAFNNSLGPNSWASQSLTYTTTPLTTGTTTSVSGIGTVYGDYLQIQSSVPIVMYSYQFATGSDAAIYFVKTFYIIGSNDGSTWYPIQYGNANSTQPTSSVATLIQNMIYVNSANAQPFGNSILTTTTYSTTQNAYTYFRLIPTATFNSSANVVQIGEWFINFQSGATYLSTNYGSTWSTVCTAPPTAPSLATSGNGLYTITGTGQLVTVYSNAALTTYTIPTLTGINANINCASISSSGQNMVILTQGTTNNVFYSTNFGVTFTGMTVGSAPMTSCAMSADGNEIMVSNAANVWTLNRNTQGFSITMGNQSGLINQGQNSIAIGNLAGVTNQSANSIILNASGAVQDAYNPGFFVSPILSQATSTQTSVNLLGYGADGQVVQSGLTVLSNGYTGIGTVAFGAYLQVYNSNAAFTSGPTVHIGDGQTDMGNYGMLQLVRANNGADNKAHLTFIKNGLWIFGMGYYPGTSVTAFGLVPSGTMATNNGLWMLGNGYVGIGTTGPSALLHIYSANAYMRDRCLTIQSGQAGIVLDSTSSGSNAHAWNIWSGQHSADTPCLNFFNMTRGAFAMCIQNSNGYVGIGVTNPYSTLHTTAGGTSVIRISTSSNGFSSQLVFDPIISGYWHNNGYGNTPTAGARGQAYGAGMILTASESGNNYEDSYMAFWTCRDAHTDGAGGLGVLTERMRLSSVGYLGIGTVNPTAILHIYGSSTVGDRDSSLRVSTQRAGLYLASLGSGGAEWNIWSTLTGESPGAGALAFYDQTNGSFRMVINNTGNVGIGVLNPTFKLTLSTDSAAKPSTSTWTVSSDERIKENIVLADVDRCVEIIRAVPLKHYRWKDEVYTNEQTKDRSKLGWIAQDVKKVFPKAVGTHRLTYNQVYEDVVKEDGSTEKKLVSEDVIEDCLDLNVDQLYAVMYGAIQKLVTENDEKTAQISTQTEQIASLESQLTAQASQLTSQTQQLSAQTAELTAQASQLSAQALQLTVQTAELTAQASQLSEVLSRLAALESKF